MHDHHKIIETCEACASHCQTCADACRDLPGMGACAAICAETRDECDRCVAEMQNGSTLLAGTCADMCNACATECESHPDNPHCAACAEACRTCANTLSGVGA